MIVYHGTTRERARKICREGFHPRKPSRRVWFASSKEYARHRAKTQARRTGDSAVVLRCEMNAAQLRHSLGAKRVLQTGGILAVRATVPVDVIRSLPTLPSEPTAPDELAAWVNEILGVKPHKGVRGRETGVMRLSRWVVNRVMAQRGRYPRYRELFEMARRFLPERLKGCVYDEQRMKAFKLPRVLEEISVRVEPVAPARQPEDDAILDRLLSSSARRRVKGVTLLRRREEEELFDWCAMLLEDPEPSVRVAALDAMLDCEYVVPEAVVPLADSKDKRIRAAAIAVLSKHGGGEAGYWIEAGLKDPSAHVRAVAARFLPSLDPVSERRAFEIALYDPNPSIARQARTLTAGKGYHPLF